MHLTIKRHHDRIAAIWLIPCIRTFLLLCACVTHVAGAATPQSFGKWQLLPAPSGEGSLAVSLKAEKAVKGWMKSSVPTLTIQCSKGKAAVYIETGMALEVTMVDRQIVHVRFDDNKPITQRWQEITNATVAASARDSTTLVKQLVQSQKFMFEFTPFSSADAQAEFDVTGLAAYLPQLARICWGN